MAIVVTREAHSLYCWHAVHANGSYAANPARRHRELAFSARRKLGGAVGDHDVLAWEVGLDFIVEVGKDALLAPIPWRLLDI